MAHYREHADAAHAELSAVKIRLEETARSAHSEQQACLDLGSLQPADHWWLLVRGTVPCVLVMLVSYGVLLPDSCGLVTLYMRCPAGRKAEAQASS